MFDFCGDSDSLWVIWNN